MENNFSTEEIKIKLKNFSSTDDFYSIFLYYKELKSFIKENISRESNPNGFKIYNNYLARFKFLALNFFTDWNEIKDLLRNHFEQIYEIENFDIWEKLKINLLAVFDLKERSEIKEGIKNTLLECDRKILDANKYKLFDNFPLSVKEWLRDYNVNLGVQKIDNLKRVQYLTNGENIKKLKAEDKDKIKNLFDLYEKLKLPSTDRHGFEEDLPMTINGKFVIFRQGDAEEVSEDLFKMIRSINIDAGKSVSNLEQPEKNVKDDEKKENKKNPELTNLQQMAEQFPVGSLERKTIEEEIKKLQAK